MKPGGGVAVPHSVSAEQALLGVLMVNNRLYDELGGSLSAEQFYVPLYAEVYRAIEDLCQRGREATPITVGEQLKATSFAKDGELFSHLAAMFENAGLGSDVRSLAEVVRTTFLQRQMMGLGDGLRRAAVDAVRPEDVNAVLEQTGSEVFRLTEVGGGRAVIRDLRDNLIEVVEEAEAAKRSGSGLTGVATGFVDLDKLLGGMQRSDLIVLGARPSMGKTSLLLNIAEAVARRKAGGRDNGAAVGVFSLEMSGRQLAQRLVAGVTGISTQRMTSGHLSADESGRLAVAAGELCELPLYIDDTPGLSIGALRSRARFMKRQYGIGLLVVDYLQLLSSPSPRSQASRVQEISDISSGLKQVARELDIPVVAASQLSRQLEQRDNKRPVLSDLRDSGSIEQDADQVWFLYRPEYYLGRALGGGDDAGASGSEQRKLDEVRAELERVKGIAEVSVSKNRKGPTDTVRLLFDGETTTFRSLARD